jgi:hypothetical protein
VIRPGPEPLSDAVEAGECRIGGAAKGKTGRGADIKALVAIGVEISGNRIGLVRMRIVNSANSKNLPGFSRTVLRREALKSRWFKCQSQARFLWI